MGIVTGYPVTTFRHVGVDLKYIDGICIMEAHLKFMKKKRDRSERKGDEPYFFFAQKTNMCSFCTLSRHFFCPKKEMFRSFLKIKVTQILAKIFGWSFFNWFIGLDFPNPKWEKSITLASPPGVASGSSTTCGAIAVGTHLGTSTSATRCRKNG